ncbi:MAG: ABC transporter ATP-binding protein [bacterium]
MSYPLPPVTPEASDSSVLVVTDLEVEFRSAGGRWPSRRQKIKTVAGVSLTVQAGETLGLVGESGCGKSTLARGVTGLGRISGGSVTVAGHDLTRARGSALRRVRRMIQLVFQDPFGSLNPRQTVTQTLGEALSVGEKLSSSEVTERVDRLLWEVGLDSELRQDYPHELSGGQRQRVAIARALATSPRVVVADEPTSALDVTVQQRVLRLLQRTQRERGLGLLLISHDLNLIRSVSQRVAVMYLGRIVELFPVASHIEPLHPYSRVLAAVVPSLRRGLQVEVELEMDQEPPSHLQPPLGCSFHPRCPQAEKVCSTTLPPLREVAVQHLVRCHCCPESDL